MTIDADIEKYINERIAEIVNAVGNQNMQIEKLRSECRSFYKEKFDDFRREVSSFIYLEREKKPYKCPVCDGNCSTRISDKTADEVRKHFVQRFPCECCQGNGVLWG